MKFVVIDASVAVKWYVNEEGSESSIALLADDELLFIAPDIFLPEVLNALLKQARLGQIADADLDRAMQDLNFTKPQLVSSSVVIEEAVRLSRAIAHPSYNCLYLALAIRWDTDFVTADQQFVSKCRRMLSEPDVIRRLQLLEMSPAS